jgi:hypothetical protein
MSSSSSTRLAAIAAATFTTLVFAAGASAQTPTVAALAALPAAPAGLGDQLFSTGGEITVEVRPATAGLVSELRLYNADGTFTPIATNREVGRIVTLPARPLGEELVFGIFVRGPNQTYKLGPADRNPDGLQHATVKNSGERQYDVGFEDILNGGDRDYDDNVFRFAGGLAPNRSPVVGDQALTVAQDGSLPVTLTGSDPDGDALTFTLLDAPLHGALGGSGANLTYTPQAGFNGTDTFGFKADDGKSAPAEGRITIKVTPPGVTPQPQPPKGRGSSVGFGDCPVGELTLLNVRRVGRRVLLTGLAERTLAGAPVNLVEGGLVIGRTTIGQDGAFAKRVALPQQRGGRVLRYQARLGALRSRNVRLRRRLITTSAKLQRGRIVIAGRLVGARRGAQPLVRLLARKRGCRTRATQIGRARLHRDGSFRVSGAPLPGVDVAVYQVRTRLRGRNTTFSLPQTIARR